MKRFLILDYLGDFDDLFDQSMAVAHFVVIPGHDFNKVPVDNPGETKVNDG